MRITSEGQVTIRIAIRERAGLMPQTGFERDGDAIRIVRRGPAPGGAAAPAPSPDCTAPAMSR